MDPSNDRGCVEPEVDLFESDDAFLLRVALPGAHPQDIHLEATGYRIFLSTKNGVPPTTSQEQPARFLRRDSSSHANRFEFTTILPFEIDPAAVHAHYQHGMLTLRLPKRQADAHRRFPISIQTQEESKPAPFNTSEPQAPTPASASTTPPPPEEWRHEGRPSAKMGLAYTPTGSEDHTTKAQSLSQQQAEPSRNSQTNGVTSAVTTGQTNPLEPPKS